MVLEKYDVAVIGGGSGGCAAAIRSADLGKKVILIEYRKNGIGGTCINRGCIPTKVLLKSAQVYSDIKKAKAYGIKVSDVSYDMKAMMAKKNSIVKNLRFGLSNYVIKPRKIDVEIGRAKIIDKNTIEIEKGEVTEKIEAENIVVATGSEPAMIPAFKIDGENVITSDEGLNLKEFPKDILIIGAGAIGIEFATLLSTFGTKVTIVEMMEHIVPILKDKEITSQILKDLNKKGITIKTGVKMDKVEIKEEGKVISTLSNGEIIESEKVLVSIGRKLNTDELGLEELGVELQKGRIKVNEKMQTNIPNIYAVGDVTAGPQLSHKAQREGVVTAEVIAGKDTKMDYKVVPWVIFSQPELAVVGITQEEAEEEGIETIVGKLPFVSNEKANAMQETKGMVKIVAKKETKEIIGAQVFGVEASVIIAELTLAVQERTSIESLSNTIHAHPTLSEAVMEASKGALGKAFHFSK